MLAKTHKQENYKGPEIGSVNCHTSIISQYVNKHLQPHANQLKSYVQDSIDFIQKLNNNDKIPENSISATMDYFILNTKNYLQIKVCAMGTKCSPTYTNIFMRIFAENYIYRLRQGKYKLYLRYVDKIYVQEQYKN